MIFMYISMKMMKYFPNIWLRDHAKDEENWDKRSSQRKTFTAALDFKFKIKSAEIFDEWKIYKNIMARFTKACNLLL